MTEGETEALNGEVIWLKHTGEQSSSESAEGSVTLLRKPATALNKVPVFFLCPPARMHVVLEMSQQKGFGCPRKASSLAPSLTTLNYPSDSQIGTKLDLVHFTIFLNKFVD